MAAFAGIDRLLTRKLDLGRGEDTFVSQALAMMPSSVDFFGKTTGFTINYSPDRAVKYDVKGVFWRLFRRLSDQGGPT